jgi:hypothetical protein
LFFVCVFNAHLRERPVFFSFLCLRHNDSSLFAPSECTI